MKVFTQCPDCGHGQAMDPQELVWTCSDCGRDVALELRNQIIRDHEYRKAVDEGGYVEVEDEP